MGAEIWPDSCALPTCGLEYHILVDLFMCCSLNHRSLLPPTPPHPGLHFCFSKTPIQSDAGPAEWEDPAHWLWGLLWGEHMFQSSTESSPSQDDQFSPSSDHFGKLKLTPASPAKVLGCQSKKWNPCSSILGLVELKLPLGKSHSLTEPLSGGPSSSARPAGPRPEHDAHFFFLFFPSLVFFLVVFFVVPVQVPSLNSSYFISVLNWNGKERKTPIYLALAKENNLTTGLGFSLYYPAGCYDQREIPREDSI